MGIWIMMLFFDLLIPGLMLLCGWMFRTAPPEQINNWFGYRTKRSKSSPEAWDFAHRYAGKIWQRSGIITLVLSIGGMLLLLGKGDTAVSLGSLGLMLLQLVPMLAVIPITERELKKHFDSEGNFSTGKSS